MLTQEQTGSKPSNTRGLVVGLTGGIACGKSTVAQFLRELGAKIISADELAHQLLQRESPVFSTIVAQFGRRILDETGNISRPLLGAIIFQDEISREILNAITHPAIVRESLRQAYQHVTKVHQKPPQVAVIDAPLLFEADMQAQVDVVVVVAASEKIQIERLLHRSAQQERKLSLTEARERIASQMPLSQKIQRADYVIHNENFGLEELREEVETLWDKLLHYIPEGKKGLDDFSRADV